MRGRLFAGVLALVAPAALAPAVVAATAGAGEVLQCGLTKAPPGGGIAAPLRFALTPDAGTARVSDPMTTFYAGGPVTARLTAEGKGWRLDWLIHGVAGDGTAPRDVAYSARISAGGALQVTATPAGGGKVLHASGTCYAR